MDALDTITKLINSPPGQFAAGGVLAGIVWKFFERVEAVLNDDTKLEVALWLLGQHQLEPKLQSWPSTFAAVFDRIFGAKHLSWVCFRRSAGASTILAAIAFGITFQNSIGHLGFHTLIVDAVLVLIFYPILIISNILPDYISLVETRTLLSVMTRHNNAVLHLALIAVDATVTVFIASWGVVSFAVTNSYIRQSHPFTWLHALATILSYPVELVQHGKAIFKSLLEVEGGFSLGYPVLLPAFFTSIWLWLYAGSGFLLKAVRRFDIGFDWFNRHFDIEKKPLQSIGLVAGAIVALVYWAAVIVVRVTG